jgi:hypothetical protein
VLQFGVTLITLVPKLLFGNEDDEDELARSLERFLHIFSARFSAGARLVGGPYVPWFNIHGLLIPDPIYLERDWEMSLIANTRAALSGVFRS